MQNHIQNFLLVILKNFTIILIFLTLSDLIFFLLLETPFSSDKEYTPQRQIRSQPIFLPHFTIHLQKCLGTYLIVCPCGIFLLVKVQVVLSFETKLITGPIL